MSESMLTGSVFGMSRRIRKRLRPLVDLIALACVMTLTYMATGSVVAGAICYVGLVYYNAFIYQDGIDTACEVITGKADLQFKEPNK